MSDLGLQIAQFAERCRADAAVRAADARKSAILNAAFDCIITMDHEGRVVEANAAAERTFGYSSAELVGRELAALIIPPSLRELHRHGLKRFVESGRSKVTGHRLEALGMRADGSEFPIELIVTRPELPGPPVFCGYLRDVTEQRERERALRKLADEQAALRRVATAVAAETDPASVFGLVTEEVGRMLGAETANMLRYDGDRFATVVGEWSRADVPAVPVGETVEMDGNTAAARVWRSRAPSRVDDYGEVEGELAARLRGLGFKSAVAAPIVLGGLWGAVVVSSVGEAFPPGAEQRIADFAELAAQALANAQSRQDLAASRARIVQAGDAERRRLERNLHDGAQQRLVSLALMLRMASRRHPQDPELEQAAEELSRALAELRELARGIHPAVLTERGLEPALEALAARAPLPVELEVAAERLPEPVEAAAYYLVAEALTNVAKYAQASEVHVQRGPHERPGQHRGGRRRRRRRARRPAGPACAGSPTGSRRSAAGWSSTAPPGPGRGCGPRSRAGECAAARAARGVPRAGRRDGRERRVPGADRRHRAGVRLARRRRLAARRRRRERLAADRAGSLGGARDRRRGGVPAGRDRRHDVLGA